jgi:hypothetical protein
MQTSDTLVVRANNPPVWGEGVELTEELRIGAVEGDEVYTFGAISGAAIGPDESVYIGDGQIPAIRQYGKDGTWIRDIGRQGQGPGEYNLISGLKMLGDGHLSLLDQRNGRVTHYRNGEYSTSFLSLSGLHSADLFAVDTSGASYVKTVVMDYQNPPQVGEPWELGWIHFDQTGEVLDTAQVPLPNDVGGGFVLAGRGGYYRPFTVMTLSAMSPHGYLVVCRNDVYALHRPLPDGRILRIERDAQPVLVGPEERAQWNASLEWFRGRSRESGTRSDFGSIPNVKPYVRHLFVDDDGRIWVAVYAEARYKPYTEAQKAERGDRPSLEWNQPLVWEVFDPRGQFLGRVTLPDKTSLVAARGNTLWGVQSGEYNEDYAVRFRIQHEERDL